MKLPGVHIKHGRYYRVQSAAERNPKTGKPKAKWYPLTRVKDGPNALYRALADFNVERRGDLAELIAEFLKTKKPELTVQVYNESEREFKIIGKAFQDFSVAQIKAGDVQQFLDQFGGHPSMAKAYKARLSTFFRWCVIRGYAEVNPCRELTLKAPPKRARKMTAEIYHMIRDRLPSIGKVFLDLSFLTCQRPTEIRLLRQSQIQSSGILFRPTKTAETSGAEVTWPVTPEIQEVLNRARRLNKVQALSGDCYVIQSRDGRPFSKVGLYALWRKACLRANVTGITTRDIRPFALSTAEKLGSTIEDLRKAAAHSTVITTEGYLAQYREVISPVRMKLPERKR